MNGKDNQPGNLNQIQNPPYKSTGRSIADDIIIERLIIVLKKIGDPHLVECLLKKLNQNSELTYAAYLRREMTPDQVIRYNRNDIIIDYENRLEFLVYNYQTPS